jgi:hypothetical protein
MYKVISSAFHGNILKAECKTLEDALLNAHSCKPCTCGGDHIVGPDGEIVDLFDLPMDLLEKVNRKADARDRAIAIQKSKTAV